MSAGFEGRHVVITGGTGALGRAVVGELLERGAFCHVPVFRDGDLDGVAFAGHERVRAVPGVDLTDEASAASFYAGCPELWASLQIAGGFAMAPLTETSAEDFLRLMKLNALSCFLCCREAVGRMRTSGGTGRLVNVAARPALVPTSGMAAYAASKSAVASITLALAEELAGEGIWVNAVVPSIMDTPSNRQAMPDADHERWPKVAEVAAAIVYLASSANAVGRGALVPVYGRS
jgi:NAD(P)-dependent dehydrogenase (short-subunit alcohol dehydrogenase family)